MFALCDPGARKHSRARLTVLLSLLQENKSKPWEPQGSEETDFYIHLSFETSFGFQENLSSCVWSMLSVHLQVPGRVAREWDFREDTALPSVGEWGTAQPHPLTVLTSLCAPLGLVQSGLGTCTPQPPSLYPSFSPVTQYSVRPLLTRSFSITPLCQLSLKLNRV